MKFSDLNLNTALLNALDERGYTTPTTIQHRVFPVVLSGRDVCGIAQTGTGKTAAYLLPLFMKLRYAQGNDVRAIILVPTKDLVVQV